MDFQWPASVDHHKTITPCQACLVPGIFSFEYGLVRPQVTCICHGHSKVLQPEELLRDGVLHGGL